MAPRREAIVVTLGSQCEYKLNINNNNYDY
jgi:hypothetical protein